MCKNTTKINRGFTLIELLVVIAIIALLLAILGPSLGAAQDKVEEVVCRSNMKQWAMVYALYANNNNDSFPQSIVSPQSPGVNAEDAYFLGALLPYYEDLNLRDCPSTRSRNLAPGNPDSYQNMGGTFIKWGPFLASPNGNRWWDSYAEGSYGFNDWVADPPPGHDTYWGIPSDQAVRTTYAEGAYMIPMIYDAVWIDTAPKMSDYAPSNEENETDTYTATWNNNSMKWFCIDRHGGGINSAFVDGDVRHVGIKELWLLKWHMKWVKTEPPNAWPSWTDKYKDYD